MKKVSICLALILLLSACGSNLVVSSPAEKNGNLGTELFESVYVPFAKGEIRTAYSDVISFLEERNYEYSGTEPSPDAVGEITVLDGDDYVYFAFMERSSGIYTIMTVSYFQASSNSEVSLSNYSPNADHRYDTLNVHKIGNSSETASSVDEQRHFLFSEIG